MKGWSQHKGTAACVMMNNIDTDQLLPARFMSQPRSAGYGDFLLYDVRRDTQENLSNEFPLNQSPDASVLICGRNFGSGSSREAAVYALVDAGIKVVIASSFGDIFAANAINNGLLPAQVSDADLQQLEAELARANSLVSIDLDTRQINTDAWALTFHLEEAWATKLRNGWDDIDITLDHADSISRFREQYRNQYRWAWPSVID